MKNPVCSVCREEMFKVRDRNTGIVYWDCKKECMFHFPIWEQELTKNEKKFIKTLTDE